MCKRISRNLGHSLFLLVLLTNITLTVGEARISVGTNETSAATTSSIEGPNVTVYNQNKALIREQRLFTLEKGINRLDWDNLPESIDIQSIDLRLLDPEQSIKVREQNYQHELLKADTILARSLGKTVHIRHLLSDGRSEEQSGILLSSSSAEENVLKIENHYVLNPSGQIEIDDLPAGLVSQPKLNFVVESSKAGQRDLVLTYETDNINWQCDYLIVLSQAQDKFDLAGLVTLENTSGVSFKNANLKLIAGNVQRNPVAMGYAETREVHSASALSSMLPPPQEQAFADYHLYTFPEPVDIDNNETKRLVLVERMSVPAVKKYVFDGQFFGYIPPKQKTAVQIKLEFANDRKNERPLPAGRVRVCQEDSDHALQLIGEDSISHTAIGEKVTIKLGDAFDIVGERTHVSGEQTATHRRLDKYKVTFDNHLNKDIVVADNEHAPDLAVFTANLPFKKLDSGTYQFDVHVPASGSAEISYQIESKI